MKNKSCFFLLIVLLLFAIASFGQITFIKTYADLYSSAYSQFVASQDDGYLMVMNGLKNNKFYLCVVKTDLAGDTLWIKEHDLGYRGYDEITGTGDEQGNIYIALDYEDINLVKLDKNGNIIWVSQYSTGSRKLAVKNNILWIGGDAQRGSYLFKIDAATGDSLWCSAIFNQDIYLQDESRCTSVAVNDLDEVVMTVSVFNIIEWVKQNSMFYKFKAGYDQPVLFPVNTSDELVVSDTKSAGEEFISVANALVNSGDSACYFLRYKSDGTLLAFKRQVFDYRVAQLQRCVIKNENLIAQGSVLRGIDRILMINSYTLNGDCQWTQFPVDSELTGCDLKITSDNGILVAGGFCNPFLVNIPFLLKTNNLGELTSIPEKTNLIQMKVYPNPARGAVTFNTPGINSGRIIIYDSMGIPCDLILIKNEKTLWNCDTVNSGIYLYQVVSGNRVISGKLVVL